MASLSGQLLIAAPTLHDPNFKQCVVLLVQHDDSAALGLILNRPSDTSLKQAWRQVSSSLCLSDELLYQGGPCEGALMALHGDVDHSDLEVMPGVHFSMDRENLEELVESGRQPAKFFVGYAGWSAGQLEEELAEGGWLLLKAVPDEVYDEGSDLWERLIRRLAQAAAFPRLNPKIIPADPSLN